jgi:NTE family protein
MRFYTVLLFLPLLLFTACTSTQPTLSPQKNKPKIAFALGGGAAKGFAHIGVIKILEQHGIKPDIITGTSAGSVIGSLYAASPNAIALQQKAMNIDESQFADYTLSSKGFVKGEALADFINASVSNRPIEKLNLPFGAVATNKATGEAIVFRAGNTGQAVRASASIPNVFQPVVIGKNSYIDGGLTQPVPVEAARSMGADIIIAIDISAKPTSGEKGFLDTIDQSINIMNQVALNKQLSMANVIIRPNTSKLSSVSFEQRHQAILEGEKAGLAALPIIKKVLEDFSKK